MCRVGSITLKYPASLVGHTLFSSAHNNVVFRYPGPSSRMESDSFHLELGQGLQLPPSSAPSAPPCHGGAPVLPNSVLPEFGVRPQQNVNLNNRRPSGQWFQSPTAGEYIHEIRKKMDRFDVPTRRLLASMCEYSPKYSRIDGPRSCRAIAINVGRVWS